MGHCPAEIFLRVNSVLCRLQKVCADLPTGEEDAFPTPGTRVGERRWWLQGKLMLLPCKPHGRAGVGRAGAGGPRTLGFPPHLTYYFLGVIRIFMMDLWPTSGLEFESDVGTGPEPGESGSQVCG